MTNLSERVQNKLVVANKVIASARTHGPKVAAILADRAREVQGPATKATPEAFNAVILALADGLAAANGTLQTTELAYFAEKADDAPVRQARDEAVAVLASMLGQLRTAAEGTLGAAGVKKYGLFGDVPRTPHKLATFAKNVVKQLEDHPLKVNNAIGTSFDTASAAAAIHTKVVELDGLLEDANREARELEDALTTRNRAMETWSDAYQGTASTLEGLYRAAGFAELAERVRPTQRKLRGEDAGDEAETEPSPAEG